MSVTVIEQITRKIATTLEGVTAGNGYAVTCTQVIRAPRRPNHSRANGVTVLRLDAMEQGTIETDISGVKLHRTGVWVIDHYIEPSDTDDTPLDALQSIAIAELERALANAYWAAFSGNGKFGDVGSNAELRLPQLLLDADGSTAGVRVSIAVSYAHTDIDPYTAL